MPLGNPNVWQKFGASYHELTSTSGAAAEQQQQQASTSGRGSSRYGGAGRPSNATAKGAGTFQLESGWSIGIQPSGTSSLYSMQLAPTETRSQYQGPPSTYQRREVLGPRKSEFPQPTYPNDYKTMTALDFSPEATAGAQRRQPISLRDSGRIIPCDVQTPEYSTSHQAHFPGRSTADARRAPAAGHATGSNGGYHIIHGGAGLMNNGFERFDGRDYRRHFPA